MRRATLALWIATAALAAASLGAQTAAAATLKADYRFENSRASSIAGAPALADLGPIANGFATEIVDGQARRVLAFPQGNGLSLQSATSLVPAGDLSVVLLVRLEEISGWRRYIDFKDGLSDDGFYNYNGALQLYPAPAGDSGFIQANTWEQVVLTRDAAGAVVAYVDGIQALAPYDDSTTGYAQIEGSDLRFFQDNTSGSATSEHSAGAVSRIRVYDGALTASEVAALDRAAPQAPPGESETLAELNANDPPELGREVNVGPARGEVLVAVPASAAGPGARARASAGLKGVNFVPLEEARQIPVGSILDTRQGTVSLFSARNRRGRLQSGRFAAGVFKVLQSRKRRAKGLTTLSLQGRAAKLRRCRRGKATADQTDASTARKRRRRLSRRAIRRLRAKAKGRYRTRGRRSAATVRGTTWITTDSCAGTLTKVKRGKVAVRDFRLKKTVVLKRGKSYLAQPRP